LREKRGKEPTRRKSKYEEGAVRFKKGVIYRFESYLQAKKKKGEGKAIDYSPLHCEKKGTFIGPSLTGTACVGKRGSIALSSGYQYLIFFPSGEKGGKSEAVKPA